MDSIFAYSPSIEPAESWCGHGGRSPVMMLWEVSLNRSIRRCDQGATCGKAASRYKHADPSLCRAEVCVRLIGRV